MAPNAPLADPELYIVDAKGSRSVRDALLTEYNQGGVSRRRKGATKPLRAAQIIADRDAATRDALNVSEARMAKRKRERETGLSRQVRRKLDSLARRAPRRGEGLWSVAQRSTPNEVSHAAKTSGTYDAWTVDPSDTAKRSAVPEDIRDVVDRPKPKAPRTLYTHDRLYEAKPSAIAVPHPGISYNPTQDEHQDLLRSVLHRAEHEESARELDRRRAGTVQESHKGKEWWEHAEEDVDKGQTDGVQSDIEIEGRLVGVGRKPSKRKSDRARRRAAQNRLAELEDRRQRRRARAETHTIATLPGVVKSIKRSAAAIDAGRNLRRQKRLAALAERGLAGRHVGRGIAPAAALDFQLGDELSGSLRSLKPEGSLWRDWAGSATRRGMVEAPRRTSKRQLKAKGRSTKITERATWRGWTG